MTLGGREDLIEMRVAAPNRLLALLTFPGAIMVAATLNV
jgi:hypothetical protein